MHLLHPLSQRERSDEAMNRILRTLSLYGLTKPTDGTGKAHDSAAPDSGSPASALSRLTRRELEVLELLTRGLPPQAVA